MRAVRRSSVLLGVVLSMFLSGAGSVGAATDRLPDLAMARLRNFKIQNTDSGQRLLRFSTIIVNVGKGPFQTTGTRPDTGGAGCDPEPSTACMRDVNQRIFNDAGGYRNVDAPGAYMYFAGDGHTHWHVRDLETYELIRSDNGSKVGTGAKHGFCFYDNYIYNLNLPGAPGSPVYRDCGKSTDLSVTMGLSVGWGDKYNAALPDQYIDITGLTPGRYRLWAIADDSNWFMESSEANQATWADLQIGTGGVTVIKKSPNP